MHLEREQFANQLLILQKNLHDKNDQCDYQTKHSTALAKSLENMEILLQNKTKEFEKISLIKKAGWVKASITSESLLCIDDIKKENINLQINLNEKSSELNLAYNQIENLTLKNSELSMLNESNVAIQCEQKLQYMHRISLLKSKLGDKYHHLFLANRLQSTHTTDRTSLQDKIKIMNFSLEKSKKENVDLLLSLREIMAEKKTQKNNEKNENNELIDKLNKLTMKLHEKERIIDNFMKNEKEFIVQIDNNFISTKEKYSNLEYKYENCKNEINLLIDEGKNREDEIGVLKKEGKNREGVIGVLQLEVDNFMYLFCIFYVYMCVYICIHIYIYVYIYIYMYTYIYICIDMYRYLLNINIICI
jgi:hypothetical protein